MIKYFLKAPNFRRKRRRFFVYGTSKFSPKCVLESFWRYFFVLVLTTLTSCSKNSQTERRVGMDTSWYPLQFGSRDNNVTAFSTELLTQIGKIEKISFVKVSVNWNDLLQGLKKGRYEAILTSMMPYVFNEKIFDFSEVYLPLGPVLVVSTAAKIEWPQLYGKEIAVVSGSTNDLLLEKIPDVLIRYYDSIPLALNAIVSQEVDGALVDVLSAVSYCRDLYQGQLKIVTKPLNEDGLRFVTLHGEAKDLIKGFDAGLKKMQKNGSYAKLLEKWELQED